MDDVAAAAAASAASATMEAETAATETVRLEALRASEAKAAAVEEIAAALAIKGTHRFFDTSIRLMYQENQRIDSNRFFSEGKSILS